MPIINLDDIKKLLSSKINEKHILLNEPMKNHTTFKIGGPADILVVPHTEEEIIFAITELRINGIPHYIMGKGSNILVKDKGYRGVIIKLLDGFSKLTTLESNIICDAGVLVEDAAKYALGKSLSGLEFAEGIPGTIGGAVCMNAGAYNGEFKNIVSEVKVLNDKNEIIILKNNELMFGYRTSKIQNDSMIVLNTTLKLRYDNHESIRSKMDEFHAMRIDKQPLEYPSAGSTFRRPEGYFVGKLINECGLKGHSIGGAKVSDKHGGFIINTGNATADDVLSLIEFIKSAVLKQFNVELHPEVKIVGE